MDTVDKFLKLFSEFELIVEPKIKNKKPESLKKNSYVESKSVSELKKVLKRLTHEYKDAQRSFKANKITRQELFDFEWRIFEIQEELRNIQGDQEDIEND